VLSALVLLIGVNVFVFSALDASCFKIDFCEKSCVLAHGEQECAPRNISLTVTDFSGSRITTYRGLYLYPDVTTVAAADTSDFEFCADAQNPIADVSPICVPLCAPVGEKFLFSDNFYSWNDTDIDCAAYGFDTATTMSGGGGGMRKRQQRSSTAALGRAAASGARSVLACESVRSETIRQTIAGADADALSFQNCQSFESRGGIPSLPLFVIKAMTVGFSLMVTDGATQYVLRLSQPIAVVDRHRRRTAAVQFVATLIAIAIVLTKVLAGAAMFVAGSYFIGNQWALWLAFLLGLSLSLLFKLCVFAPGKILLWWLLIRCGCWRCCKEDEQEQLHALVSQLSAPTLATRDEQRQAERKARRGGHSFSETMFQDANNFAGGAQLNSTAIPPSAVASAIVDADDDDINVAAGSDRGSGGGAGHGSGSGAMETRNMMNTYDLAALTDPTGGRGGGRSKNSPTRSRPTRSDSDRPKRMTSLSRVHSHHHDDASAPPATLRAVGSSGGSLERSTSARRRGAAAGATRSGGGGAGGNKKRPTAREKKRAAYLATMKLYAESDDGGAAGDGGGADGAHGAEGDARPFVLTCSCCALAVALALIVAARHCSRRRSASALPRWPSAPSPRCSSSACARHDAACQPCARSSSRRCARSSSSR